MRTPKAVSKIHSNRFEQLVKQRINPKLKWIKAGNEAISQIQDQERVAEWSASNAVRDAVGKDYSNQLATTAQFVAQFTAPVTKDQAQNVFNVSWSKMFLSVVRFLVVFYDFKCALLYISCRRLETSRKLQRYLLPWKGTALLFGELLIMPLIAIICKPYKLRMLAIIEASVLTMEAIKMKPIHFRCYPQVRTS